MSEFVQQSHRRGTFAEALELVATWKATADLDALDAYDLAEGFEMCEELAFAERWFNIAARWADREGEEWIYEMALIGRRRSRTDQGKPEEVQDVEAREILARRQRERGAGRQHREG